MLNGGLEKEGFQFNHSQQGDRLRSLIDFKPICTTDDPGCSRPTMLIEVCNTNTIVRPDTDTNAVAYDSICHNPIAYATLLIHKPLIFFVFEVPSGRYYPLLKSRLTNFILIFTHFKQSNQLSELVHKLGKVLLITENMVREQYLQDVVCLLLWQPICEGLTLIQPLNI